MRSHLPLQEGTDHPALFQGNEDGPGSDTAHGDLWVCVLQKKEFEGLSVNISVNVCVLLDCGQQQISNRHAIAKLR